MGKYMEENEVELVMPKFPMNFRKVIPPAVISSKTKPFYPVAKLTNDPTWQCGLIPLPRDYTDLMNLAANFVCCNSVTGESKTPALFLVCGLMVCSQSHCCDAVMSGFKCGGCTTLDAGLENFVIEVVTDAPIHLASEKRVVET